MGNVLVAPSGASVPAEGSGWGILLIYGIIALAALAIFGPLAYFIARDANRRGRNGWAWGLLFFWQPMIVGVAYLVVRSRPPRHHAASVPPSGWYPDPGGAGMRWWDGATWTEHIVPSPASTPPPH